MIHKDPKGCGSHSKGSACDISEKMLCSGEMDIPTNAIKVNLSLTTSQILETNIDYDNLSIGEAKTILEQCWPMIIQESPKNSLKVLENMNYLLRNEKIIWSELQNSVIGKFADYNSLLQYAIKEDTCIIDLVVLPIIKYSDFRLSNIQKDELLSTIQILIDKVNNGANISKYISVCDLNSLFLITQKLFNDIIQIPITSEREQQIFHPWANLSLIIIRDENLSKTEYGEFGYSIMSDLVNKNFLKDFELVKHFEGWIKEHDYVFIPLSDSNVPINILSVLVDTNKFRLKDIEKLWMRVCTNDGNLSSTFQVIEKAICTLSDKEVSELPNILIMPENPSKEFLSLWNQTLLNIGTIFIKRFGNNRIVLTLLDLTWSKHTPTNSSEQILIEIESRLKKEDPLNLLSDILDEFTQRDPREMVFVLSKTLKKLNSYFFDISSLKDKLFQLMNSFFVLISDDRKMNKNIGKILLNLGFKYAINIDIKTAQSLIGEIPASCLAFALCEEDRRSFIIDGFESGRQTEFADVLDMAESLSPKGQFPFICEDVVFDLVKKGYEAAFKLILKMHSFGEDINVSFTQEWQKHFDKDDDRKSRENMLVLLRAFDAYTKKFSLDLNSTKESQVRIGGIARCSISIQSEKSIAVLIKKLGDVINKDPETIYLYCEMKELRPEKSIREESALNYAEITAQFGPRRQLPQFLPISLSSYIHVNKPTFDIIESENERGNTNARLFLTDNDWSIESLMELKICSNSNIRKTIDISNTEFFKYILLSFIPLKDNSLSFIIESGFIDYILESLDQTDSRSLGFYIIVFFTFAISKCDADLVTKMVIAVFKFISILKDITVDEQMMIQSFVSTIPNKVRFELKDICEPTESFPRYPIVNERMKSGQIFEKNYNPSCYEILYHFSIFDVIKEDMINFRTMYYLDIELKMDPFQEWEKEKIISTNKALENMPNQRIINRAVISTILVCPEAAKVIDGCSLLNIEPIIGDNILIRCVDEMSKFILSKEKDKNEPEPLLEERCLKLLTEKDKNAKTLLKFLANKTRLSDGFKDRISELIIESVKTGSKFPIHFDAPEDMSSFVTPRFIEEISELGSQFPETDEVGISQRKSKFSGLKNLGMTCYFNSMLQQFFFIPTLRKRIEEYNGDDRVFKALSGLFKEMETGGRGISTPIEVCRAWKNWDGSTLQMNVQQDAAEFVVQFIDRLEALPGNAAKEFTGFLKDQIRELGSKEGYHNEARIPFTTIDFALNGKCLEEAMNEYIRPEIIERYKAEKIGEITVERSTKLDSIGDHIVVVLKRFEFDVKTLMRTKKNDRLEFPLEVDFGKMTVDGKEQRYKLGGVIAHMGSIDCGHYISICKDRQSQKWYFMDDERVSRIKDIDGLLNQFSGGDSEGFAAYVLFYDREGLEYEAPKADNIKTEKDEKLKVFGNDGMLLSMMCLFSTNTVDGVLACCKFMLEFGFRLSHSHYFFEISAAFSDKIVRIPDETLFDFFCSLNLIDIECAKEMERHSFIPVFACVYDLIFSSASDVVKGLLWPYAKVCFNAGIRFRKDIANDFLRAAEAEDSLLDYDEVKKTVSHYRDMRNAFEEEVEFGPITPEFLRMRRKIITGMLEEGTPKRPEKENKGDLKDVLDNNICFCDIFDAFKGRTDELKEGLRTLNESKQKGMPLLLALAVCDDERDPVFENPLCAVTLDNAIKASNHAIHARKTFGKYSEDLKRATLRLMEMHRLWFDSALFDPLKVQRVRAKRAMWSAAISIFEKDNDYKGYRNEDTAAKDFDGLRKLAEILHGLDDDALEAASDQAGDRAAAFLGITGSLLEKSPKEDFDALLYAISAVSQPFSVNSAYAFKAICIAKGIDADLIPAQNAQILESVLRIYAKGARKAFAKLKKGEEMDVEIGVALIRGIFSKLGEENSPLLVPSFRALKSSYQRIIEESPDFILGTFAGQDFFSYQDEMMQNILIAPNGTELENRKEKEIETENARKVGDRVQVIEVANELIKADAFSIESVDEKMAELSGPDWLSSFETQEELQKLLVQESFISSLALVFLLRVRPGLVTSHVNVLRFLRLAWIGSEAPSALSLLYKRITSESDKALIRGALETSLSLYVRLSIGICSGIREQFTQLADTALTETAYALDSAREIGVRVEGIEELKEAARNASISLPALSKLSNALC